MGADVATGLRKRNTLPRIRTSSEPPLPIMLNTANKIARLLARMGVPELTKRFTAQYRGITIPWREFYCDLTTDDFEDALRVLETQARSGSTQHPVAVAGIVKNVRSGRDGKPYAELKMARSVRNERGERWLHVRIYSGSQEVVNYQPGVRVLAYGIWKEYLPEKSSNHWITLWYDHASAVKKLPN